MVSPQPSGSRSGAAAPPLRVGLIGARRTRQGIGEWVARAFATAGAELVGVVGTSPASVEAARAGLRERFGLEPRGYVSTEALLQRESLDVLAICSPAGTHADALHLALEAGVHVLCEKPLWWDEGALVRGAALGEDTRALAEAFFSRGLLLALNTQWPCTLPAWRALFPDVDVSRPRRFEMLLAPVSSGATMVVDAAPHAISLLAALTGRGTVADAQVERAADEALVLRFVWRHAQGETGARLRLRRCAEPPRPAGYGIDGHWAEREIELPAYAMSFRDGARRVPLPDPLDELVADFVRRVGAGGRADVDGLVESQVALRDLVAATGASEAAG